MQHRLYHLKTKINLILPLDKYVFGRVMTPAKQGKIFIK